MGSAQQRQEIIATVHFLHRTISKWSIQSAESHGNSVKCQSVDLQWTYLILHVSHEDTQYSVGGILQVELLKMPYRRCTMTCLHIICTSVSKMYTLWLMAWLPRLFVVLKLAPILYYGTIVQNVHMEVFYIQSLPWPEITFCHEHSQLQGIDFKTAE